jgi:hypothetical protein
MCGLRSLPEEVLDSIKEGTRFYSVFNSREKFREALIRIAVSGASAIPGINSAWPMDVPLIPFALLAEVVR